MSPPSSSSQPKPRHCSDWLFPLLLLILLPLSTGCQYAHYDYMLEVREPNNPPPNKITHLPAQLLLTWNGGWRMASFPENGQVKRISFRQKLGIFPFNEKPSGFNIEVSKEGYQTFTAQYDRKTGVIVLQNDHAFRSDVILLQPLNSPYPSRRLTGMPDVPDETAANTPATEPTTAPAIHHY